MAIQRLKVRIMARLGIIRVCPPFPGRYSRREANSAKENSRHLTPQAQATTSVAWNLVRREVLDLWKTVSAQGEIQEEHRVQA